jgi:hypothetical protein
MPSINEVILAKTKRLEEVGSKAEAFVAAGGDLKSPEAVPLGMELIHAFNDLSTEFGHPILTKIEGK